MEENVDERSDSKFSDYIPKAQAEGISNNFIEESFGGKRRRSEASRSFPIIFRRRSRRNIQKNHNIYLLVNIMQNYPQPYQYQHPFPYYYHYIFYVLFLFILIILIICAYIKIRFRFWAMQPVFHIYDLHYYLFPCGIINYELPEKNQYTNFKDIETIQYSKLSDLKLKQFTHFIKQHYLQNGDNQYCPTTKNITGYFTGHNCTSFFSFYYEDELLIDVKTQAQIPNKKIAGVMTTRPIHITINKAKNSDATFDAYYVDYLCVDKTRRKQNIAPQVIQTHHYNQRLINKNILVSLFKREGDLTGIVPLCVYNTYCFDMNRWAKPPPLLPYVSLIEVGKTNIHHLFDFFRDHNEKFDICILTETANMMQLINSKTIYIYMIIEQGEVICAYFFRRSYTYLKKGTEVLCCFASINCSKNVELFAHGYKVALWKIYESHTAFKCAAIENISDNDVIVDNILERSTPIIVNPNAYFFYNFAYHTFQPKKVLVIN